MTKPLGGRGNRAPYQTIQMRVPVPIKDQVNQLIEGYRIQALQGEKPVDRFSNYQQIADRVLADMNVTRGGKDRGSCKRAIEAFLTELQKS